MHTTVRVPGIYRLTVFIIEPQTFNFCHAVNCDFELNLRSGRQNLFILTQCTKVIIRLIPIVTFMAIHEQKVHILQRFNN